MAIDGRKSPWNKLPHFTAVIPAGGTGTRLWPLSRASHPKFLLDLAGSGQSMLRDTVQRIAPLAGTDVLIVTGRSHASRVADDVPPQARRPILVEPAPKNSMPAIGLAAAILEREDPQAVIGTFPADHIIDDVDAFLRSVQNAYDAACEGFVVTLGISPTYAATGFGYIEVGQLLARGSDEPVHHATAFREKPAQDLASRYLGGGRHLWNAGIFLARATRLLDLLQSYDSSLAQTLRQIAREPENLASHWSTAPSISIDHAVAEPAARDGHVAVVPTKCGWDDVGDFLSLSRRFTTSDALQTGVLGRRDDVIDIDSAGLVVPQSGRLVAALGLEHVIIVDTPDALLVADAGRAQEVGGLIDLLRARDRDDLL